MHTVRNISLLILSAGGEKFMTREKYKGQTLTAVSHAHVIEADL